MKLLVLSATLALLAVVGFAHHGHPILHDLAAVAKLPREKWVAALQTILQRRQYRNDIDDNIMALLEELRKIMTVGYPELGIPQLDPYLLKHYELDMTGTGLPPVQVTMDEATILGISKFVINSISNDMEHLKANYSFTIPLISAVGTYKISGEFMGMELFGDGPFTADIGALSAWGNIAVASVGDSLDGEVYMKEIGVDFEMGSLKVNFTNLMGGGSMGDMLNQVISEEGPSMLQEYKEDVTKLISNAVISIANPILGQFTLREILDYLGVPHSF